MYKAVIVDDEIWSRNIIRNFVKWEEKSITLVGEAEGALEGLEMIKQLSPDIVITDMNMPQMDGVMLLKELSTFKKTLKCIVVSGHDDFLYMKQAIQSQVVEYLLKPIDAKELNNAVDKCICELYKSKSFKSVLLHEVIPEHKLELFTDELKSFKHALQHYNIERVEAILERMAYITMNGQLEEYQVTRGIHSYISPIVRQELDDVFRNHHSAIAGYIDIDGQVSEGLSIEAYYDTLRRNLQSSLHMRRLLVEAASEPLHSLVKKYIDEYFREDIRLGALAERFFVSKEHLCFVFKQAYGQSIGQYILDRKMQEAINMLSEGDSPRDIADCLCYRELSYFYKVFKKYHGVSPKSYIQHHLDV